MSASILETDSDDLLDRVNPKRKDTERCWATPNNVESDIFWHLRGSRQGALLTLSSKLRSSNFFSLEFRLNKRLPVF